MPNADVIVQFFAIRKDTSRAQRYWLAEQGRLTDLLAATFYMEREDAERELAKMKKHAGQYSEAVIVECAMTVKG